jgi:hypothetical protein
LKKEKKTLKIMSSKNLNLDATTPLTAADASSTIRPLTPSKTTDVTLIEGSGVNNDLERPTSLDGIVPSKTIKLERSSTNKFKQKMLERANKKQVKKQDTKDDGSEFVENKDSDVITLFFFI